MSTLSSRQASETETTHIKPCYYPADRPHRSHAHHSIHIPDRCDFGDRSPHLHPPGFNHRIDSGHPAGQNGLIAKVGAIAVSEECDRHIVLVSWKNSPRQRQSIDATAKGDHAQIIVTTFDAVIF
jgi:hypothetical protein